jgi:hypothetical protein
VRRSDAGRWAAAAAAARDRELAPQLAALRRGLGSVVPLRALALFSPAELEERACGEADVDLDRLAAKTEYKGFKRDDPLIKAFWRVLADMTPHQRCSYLRYVWGRSRLPAPGTQWSSLHTIERAPGGDGALPTAHTCFATLDLPHYSSAEGEAEAEGARAGLGARARARTASRPAARRHAPPRPAARPPSLAVLRVRLLTVISYGLGGVLMS